MPSRIVRNCESSVDYFFTVVFIDGMSKLSLVRSVDVSFC